MSFPLSNLKPVLRAGRNPTTSRKTMGSRSSGTGIRPPDLANSGASSGNSARALLLISCEVSGRGSVIQSSTSLVPPITTSPLLICSLAAFTSVELPYLFHTTFLNPRRFQYQDLAANGVYICVMHVLQVQRSQPCTIHDREQLFPVGDELQR